MDPCVPPTLDPGEPYAPGEEALWPNAHSGGSCGNCLSSTGPPVSPTSVGSIRLDLFV